MRLLVAVALLLTSLSAQARVPDSQAEIQLSFAPVVKQVAPAVVNIYTRRVVKTRSISPLFDDPFFKRFFGDEFGGPRERVQNSLGSGVIVRDSGIIVTNNHVIQGAEQITVALADRREFDAELVFKDQRTDLAILKINTEGEKLPSLRFGDSDALEVGDLVLAVGNPFGVGQTVTSGIVSALARTQIGISDYGFFIQTDAAINPGNSGGALVAMDGSLIGINTAIYSKSGGSVGIGFAIPSNMVESVVRAALSDGSVLRPWLGANGQPVTSEVAQGLGIERPGGVLVNEIYQGGPADRAGIRVGDVVLDVDDQPVFDMQGIRFRLATKKDNGKAKLSVWRDGSVRTRLMVREAPPEFPKKNETELEGEHPLNLVKIANLSPAFAEELGRNPMDTGVVVTGFDRRSLAARLRMRPGDIIAAIDDAPTPNVAAVKRAIANHKPGDWKLTVSRNGELKSVTIPAR